MFFARMTPTLLPGTIEQQIPFPSLDDSSRFVESAHDGKHLRKAAADPHGPWWGSGKETEETVAMRKGDFWCGFFCTAWENEEGTVSGPGVRCVLGVGEDGK